jgi:hypothetical protein
MSEPFLTPLSQISFAELQVASFVSSCTVTSKRVLGVSHICLCARVQEKHVHGSPGDKARATMSAKIGQRRWEQRSGG